MKIKAFMKKHIYAVCIITVILIIAIVRCVVYLPSDEFDVFKIVMTSRKYYKHVANYESILVENDKKEITIKFDYNANHKEKDLIKIKDTYKTIKKEFKKGKGKNFKDYKVILIFRDIGDEFCILFTNNNENYLDIHNFLYFKMKDVAQNFSDTTNIFTCLYREEDLSEIIYFNNLKYISTSHPITKEEKEYILSVFPDCEVDCQIKDK